MFDLTDSAMPRADVAPTGSLVAASSGAVVPCVGCRGVMVAMEPSDETFGMVETPLYFSSLYHFLLKVL